jgi:hypothetical protein
MLNRNCKDDEGEKFRVQASVPEDMAIVSRQR